jgi:hypothetical protein
VGTVRPPTGPYRYSSSSTPFSKTEKRLLGVFVLWAIAVAAMIGSTDIWDILFTATLGPGVGLARGAYAGFAVGFGAIAKIATGLLLPPPVMAGILGALAGALTAWLQRASVIKNELRHSFVASLFSPETFGGNLPAFVCVVIVNTFIGYAVASGFASVGVLGSSSHDLTTVTNVVLGGCCGSGDTSYWIMTFFALLAGLLVAGGIIGGCAGGIVGGMIGAAFSSIGVATVVQSGTEGAVFRFFADFRPGDIKSSRLKYLLVGAAAGIGTGVTAGAGTGAVLFLVRFTGIIT